MQKRLEHRFWVLCLLKYYESIIQYARHHQVTGLTRKHIGHENGVLGGVVSTLTSYAAPGDAVLA